VSDPAELNLQPASFYAILETGIALLPVLLSCTASDIFYPVEK
jgi:hypothetical protein